MLAKLTTITGGRQLAGDEVEVGDDFVQNTTPWVTKSMMPQVHGGCGGDKGLWCRRNQRAQLAMTVTSEEHHSSWNVLN